MVYQALATLAVVVLAGAPPVLRVIDHVESPTPD